MNCPHCQRLLYSRQHSKCGFCGGELPAEVRLDEFEIDELKAEQADIAARREIRKKQDEEEARKNSQDPGGPHPIWF